MTYLNPFDNGPRRRATRGRNRNTAVNNSSRQGQERQPAVKARNRRTARKVAQAGTGTTVKGSALLRPSDVVGLNQQLQGLETGKADALAQLALQRAQLRSGFINTRQDIRSAKQQGIQDVSMDALERGVSGSTVDFHQRQGVKEEAATALARAQSERDQQLAANLLARLQTRRDYRLGTTNVAATRAAMIAEANIDRYAKDGVMGLGVKPPPNPTAADYGFDLNVGSGGQPGGGGGGGQASGQNAGQLGRQQTQQYAQMTNNINQLLQRVKEMPVTMPDGTPNKGRAGIIQRLYQLWDERNNILVQGGMQPYRRRILNRRVRG